MINILGLYPFLSVVLTILWSVLLTILCGAWATWVALDKYRNLDSDLRREIVIGLLLITLLTGIGGVIAAYWSKPIASVVPSNVSTSR
jgi:hypothetical protein